MTTSGFSMNLLIWMQFLKILNSHFEVIIILMRQLRHLFYFCSFVTDKRNLSTYKFPQKTFNELAHQNSALELDKSAKTWNQFLLCCCHKRKTFSPEKKNMKILSILESSSARRRNLFLIHQEKKKTFFSSIDCSWEMYSLSQIRLKIVFVCCCCAMSENLMKIWVSSEAKPSQLSIKFNLMLHGQSNGSKNGQKRDNQKILNTPIIKKKRRGGGSLWRH